MSSQQEPVSLDLDRRSFMKASALAGSLVLAGSGAGHALSEDATGGGPDSEGAEGRDVEGKQVKTVCNYCAVGCGFKGERKGDAFVGQEPWHENPINNGSLCSKGAGIYATEHSPKRMKHPMKKVNGEWQKVSWDEAFKTIGDEMKRLREEYGPDSVFWAGSAHHVNETAYALRKLVSLYGTNNTDNQARICHSTTVTGLANTFGYGAMTNTINDYRNYDLLLIVGQNPAESHPIAMQHILEGQARGGTIVNVDPRYTKTSAHADKFQRMRPGSDTAFMMGLLHYLNQQNELDRDMIQSRVQGWPDLQAKLGEYDLETVSELTWVDAESIREIGDLIIENKPKIQIEWAMGGTQHNNGTQNVRSYAMTALGTQGIGAQGAGLQVMRGHANIQGSTDVGPNPHILPAYYTVSSPGSWQWWTTVWSKSPFTSGEISFDELYQRFEKMPKDLYQRQKGGNTTRANKAGRGPTKNSQNRSEQGGQGAQGGRTGGEIGDLQIQNLQQQGLDPRSLMFQKGFPVSRWYEGALPKEERLHDTPIYQPHQLKMAVFQGHSVNSLTEMNKVKRAMEQLDLLVIADMFPSVASVLPDRDDGVLFLPVASPYEHWGSATNSHRSIQWRDPVRPPSHNTKTDMEIVQRIAAELGYEDHFDWGNGPELFSGESTYADALREINLGAKTIGYCQAPERLKKQKEHDGQFSTETLRAESTDPEDPVHDEYWGLPWPCWGEGHPGTPIIWNDHKDPREGGHDFRARWGTKAPTPQEWQNLPLDEDYPLEQTIQQQGRSGLSLMRESYSPDWQTSFGGQVRGVPQYPKFTTTLPENLENSDALTLPYRYALDPTKSPYDTAKALAQRGRDVDPQLYRQFDHAQPDPPTGRGKARAVAWNFLDMTPVHREPIESPKIEWVKEWPANGYQRNVLRLDQNNRKEQAQSTMLAHKQNVDTVMTTGRQVEHQGGGGETRNNVYLADLQPHMYAEIHPEKAEQLGVEGGEMVVVETTNRGSVLVRARVTNRPAPKETFLPFHWGGIFEGESLEERYPEGHVPFAIGDSVNAITVRGYDAQTAMQETKVSLVRIRKATQKILDERNMETDLDNFTTPQEEEDIGLQKEYDVRNNRSIQ